MTTRRTIEIMLIAAVVGAGLAIGAPAEAAPADDALLQPTPLILKDGRIANVSVHVLAFPPGQSVLGAANSGRLGSLSGELATDCFLTAQVIGHVGSTEVGNDTLSAHRLARARADAVQASLIADGLPAKAIASVWDWQFMVREPRATLWVFRLTPGEDCEGTPLDSAASALVAGAEPPPAATPASEPRPAASPRSVALAEPAASAAQDERPDQAAEPAPEQPPAPVAIVRAAEARPAPVTVPAAASRPPAEVPSVTQALPAVSPKPAPAVASQSETKPAAVAERARQVPEVVAALPEPPAKPPATPAAAGGGGEELVIVFPTNSSYFPPEASAQLRALLRQLAGEQRYQVTLRASVSGSQKVIGAESSEEAAQYNQWLAERRVDRVRAWLDQNANGSALVIKPEYRADDESRRVVVRVVPTG